MKFKKRLAERSIESWRKINQEGVNIWKKGLSFYPLLVVAIFLGLSPEKAIADATDVVKLNRR
ncbi:MAG: hypothetical protein QME81_16485 [bacterium]|nr:hypothetical protein [bacterium]